MQNSRILFIKIYLFIHKIFNLIFFFGFWSLIHRYIYIKTGTKKNPEIKLKSMNKIENNNNLVGSKYP